MKHIYPMFVLVAVVIVLGSALFLPQPAVQAAASGYFAEPDQMAGTPAIAIDAQGGTHLAYRYHVPAAEGANLVYAYCPPPASACTDAANWQRVNLGGLINEVQLVLTSTGKPRVLVTGHPADNLAEHHFIYGACDTDCLTQGTNGWSFADVTYAYTDGVGDTVAPYLPQRYFALDPQDRPRFVFYNADFYAEPDRYGGYYAACDTDCANQERVAEQWTVTKFTQEQFHSEFSAKNEKVDLPSLTFTSDGRPRVVSLLFPLDSLSDEMYFLAYFACDQDCTDAANWERVKVADRGQGGYPIWDIALDANNNPRIAFFQAPTEDGTGDRLYYLTCDANCLNPASWNRVNLGLPTGAGDGVDLVLDSQERPRMAYLMGEDLHYSSCDGGCDNADNWKHRELDTTGQMEADFPVPLPITCDAGVWDTSSPVLAFDPNNNPHIAYDGSYKARCLYQDPNDPNNTYYEFREIKHAVRVVQGIGDTTTPPTSRVYVPLVVR